jgi:hypothetical protein
MNLNTMSLPWWARPTKYPPKGERNEQRERTQEAQKPKLFSAILTTIY